MPPPPPPKPTAESSLAASLLLLQAARFASEDAAERQAKRAERKNKKKSGGHEAGERDEILEAKRMIEQRRLSGFDAKIGWAEGEHINFFKDVEAGTVRV